MPLVIFGLLVSIPIIVGGSQLVIRLMDRFPFVITLGAMLLGWIAGGMAIDDPAMLAWVPTVHAPRPGGGSDVVPAVHYACASGGALLVLLVGKLLARRHKSPGGK
jgi:predicted tellurium resistance membrane protein TerC